MDKIEVKTNFNLLHILTIAFIILKLCNVINWSWFLILLPSIINWVLILIMILIVVLVKSL